MGQIMYPQAWLRTQSWIRPGQFLLSRSWVSCILIWQMGKWNKKDFFQVIQRNMAKLDLLTTFYDCHSKKNCASYTGYWSIKTENDWQAWVHDSWHSFKFKQCVTVHEIRKFFCDNSLSLKLESRLLGEISITSDMQMTPPLWQKAKKN